MTSVKHLPNNLLFILIFILTSIKIFFFLGVKIKLFSISSGGGNDADYYHGYAIGYYDFAVNIWPIILRKLNEIGFYQRDFISYLLLLLNLIFIPFLTCKLAGLNFRDYQKYFIYLFLICAIYPTLYFFTFDVYRDVFMVFSFLLSCLCVKRMLKTNNTLSFTLLFLVNIVLGWYLFSLRPYLGFSFIISLFLIRIKFTKKRILFLSLLYLFILFLASVFGLLDPLTSYRTGFEEIKAGSTLGLDFSNPFMFIPNLFLSALGQLFGLYIVNPMAIILLLVETIPVLFMLKFILTNIKLADNFARFFIVFFMLYASIWLIGNDNLGTAIRLRLYNYFAVYICFFYILRLKQNLISKNVQVKQ